MIVAYPARAECGVPPLARPPAPYQPEAPARATAWHKQRPTAGVLSRVVKNAG
jgi:hypothetical protein